MTTIHENYSRNETVIGGSERSFGIVMTAAFAVMSLLNWWHEGHSWRWTGGIAALFLAATLFHPAALKPLNRLWLKFGLLLHNVVNPIVMALVVVRGSAKDTLNALLDAEADRFARAPERATISFGHSVVRNRWKL
jgi:hypothetical protein